MQFKWDGPELDAAESLLRPAPPSPTGGWGDLPGSSGALWYDCDGFGIPYQSTGARYQAVAVLPDAGGDVDVRLHDRVSGIYDGFDLSLAESGWGPDESDFVVINVNRAGTGDLDAGVIDASGGTGGSAGYRIERVAAQVWGAAPVETPPQSFTDRRIVDLHDIQFAPGEYTVSVESVDGSVDWGVAVHPKDVTYCSKSTVLGDAAAWGAGPGLDESTNVTIDTAGRYCVSVWRVDNAAAAPATGGDAGAAKAPAMGTYILRVNPATTAVGPGVPDAPLALAGLRSITPNPFNPRTTVAFVVDRVGPVQLDLYNLRGERVRRLVDQVMSPGVHAVDWDGRDDGGQSVSSGAYLVQMRAGGAVTTRKVVLAK